MAERGVCAMVGAVEGCSCKSEETYDAHVNTWVKTLGKTLGKDAG